MAVSVSQEGGRGEGWLCDRSAKRTVSQSKHKYVYAYELVGPNQLHDVDENRSTEKYIAQNRTNPNAICNS